MTAARCSTASAHCTATAMMSRGTSCTPGGGRLLKLPSYPWQTKRFWNETTEAMEALFYDPVHPLLGQSVSAVHPTWEAELSTVLNAFLADHRVQGSVVVPGAVYVEMALAAANAIYGSNHSVDNLVLHRAVILDDTCDPILRTTLNEARRHAGVRRVHGNGRRRSPNGRSPRPRNSTPFRRRRAPSRPAGQRRAGHLDRW